MLHMMHLRMNLSVVLTLLYFFFFFFWYGFVFKRNTSSYFYIFIGLELGQLYPPVSQRFVLFCFVLFCYKIGKKKMGFCKQGLVQNQNTLLIFASSQNFWLWTCFQTNKQIDKHTNKQTNKHTHYLSSDQAPRPLREAKFKPLELNIQ